MGNSVKKTNNIQHTYMLETTAGIDFLVLYEDEDVKYMFDLYKNDEAGEHLKGAELISYERID